MKTILTINKLKEIPYGIFTTGETKDTPEGINVSNGGRRLRWVATRGGGPNDWTIYIHYAENSPEWIKANGDKVTGEANIKKLVPCDDEAFKTYRF